MSVDVEAAFDNLRPDVIIKALPFWLVSSRLIAYLAQEMIGLECMINFLDISLDEPFPFDNALRQ